VLEFLIALVPTWYYGDLANNANNQIDAYSYTYIALGVFVGTFILVFFLKRFIAKKLYEKI
jgi:hypothetical protein